MKRTCAWVVVMCWFMASCDDSIDLDPLETEAPIEARMRPKPIIGGTLTLTSNDLAVAADPDRDQVHVVDLVSRHVLHTIELAPGDEPGRVVEGAQGTAHVVLRGSGSVATLDLAAGTVVARVPVCAEPRGIAHDASAGVLHVACADGSLVQLDATSSTEVSRTRLEPDLRDVLLVDGKVKVSQFRSASLLDVDGSRAPQLQFDRSIPHVAWRSWVDAHGEIMILHQLASTEPVQIEPNEAAVSNGAAHPYGGGTFCEPGLSAVAITRIGRDDTKTVTLANAPLTVDAAFWPRGDAFALAMPGAAEGKSTVAVVNFGETCIPEGEPIEEGQVTAVAFTQTGELVMQSREPARLLVRPAPFSAWTEIIELPGESRLDTGHDLFHRATDSGLSCASCHPEGTDDGHVWNFVELGLRRTQPLDVGLADTAPFHWDGDMKNLDTIMGEVLVHRMGGKRQSEARLAAFSSWMFAQQRPPAATRIDDPLVLDRGRTLFEHYGCATCHDGPALGGTQTHPIRGVTLQVPSLRRVSLHPPYMHDGRSPTLEDAVVDMIESTTTRAVDDDAVRALADYLRTL